jgi:hypothetical protein
MDGSTSNVPHVAPRLVSSLEEAVAARRARTPVAEEWPVSQLLHAMHTVKAARFIAAQRFERKNMLSTFALSMVSLYFVGLAVWQTIYGAGLGEAANRLITLVSIMSSIFTLVLALIESMNDYKLKAHHMHTCALAVNDLFHELRLMPQPDVAVIQDFRRRYNDVVRGCPYNHSRIDYLMARAQRSVPRTDKLIAYVRYGLDVYGLYAVCLAVPPLVLLVFA